ncbi:hypothetical protein [Lysinibacillus sp. Bpr_S20]|uniref:hypothetical protein n=1 Tax=Lysinibacillus sp. Bpr_S20 TaxID=2933964 RepID=UPI002010EE1F|nr:hypothetical protein [Lysinibacillus sp. Bpr_S20]MCL1700747.1 hypothetical protein [Lysinibacillus sp. Bpr_S20]
MNKKYSEKRYNDFGLFIFPNKRGEGFKIIRDEDGWIFDKTYKDEQAAQNWIDDMIELTDKSKAKWKANT